MYYYIYIILLKIDRNMKKIINCLLCAFSFISLFEMCLNPARIYPHDDNPLEQFGHIIRSNLIHQRLPMIIIHIEPLLRKQLRYDQIVIPTVFHNNSIFDYDPIGGQMLYDLMYGILPILIILLLLILFNIYFILYDIFKHLGQL